MDSTEKFLFYHKMRHQQAMLFIPSLESLPSYIHRKNIYVPRCKSYNLVYAIPSMTSSSNYTSQK